MIDVDHADVGVGILVIIVELTALARAELLFGWHIFASSLRAVFIISHFRLNVNYLPITFFGEKKRKGALLLGKSMVN